ncbi:HPr-rel-A system PqqD family peptide chaperone [Duganella sp. P38]|uniref:HPr-rel-A system PqqD family peptide chaperone n=1 Tax=Duganella sp. P38 TaxID=3423949 RepID=UPI003D7A6787
MWRVSGGQQLRHRVWAPECVLYNDLSGDTHVLGADALALLLQLRACPASEADLARLLGYGDDDAALAALLAQLENLSLVERAC